MTMSEEPKSGVAEFRKGQRVSGIKIMQGEDEEPARVLGELIAHEGGDGWRDRPPHALVMVGTSRYGVHRSSLRHEPAEEQKATVPRVGELWHIDMEVGVVVLVEQERDRLRDELDRGYTDGSHGSIPKMGPRDEQPASAKAGEQCVRVGEEEQERRLATALAGGGPSTRALVEYLRAERASRDH